MADLKPVYLVAGDDNAKIDSWRSRVRKRAESERGPGGLEHYDGGTAAPEEVAAALAMLSFDTGTRYLMVEDAGAWKAGQLAPLEAVMGDMPPDTVLVLIVRGKPLKQLSKAVEKAGGELRECAAPKPWELPKWVAERAGEIGLQLDQDVARMLVSAVPGGQQQLARELEKLALGIHPRNRVSTEDVEALTASDTSPQVFDLADALVAGDLSRTLALAEDLSTHDERPGRLIYAIVRRLREVHRAASLIEMGMPEQKVTAALKAPPWLAKKTVAKAKKADRATLERALCLFADLEVELRGGGGQGSQLDEDTAFSLALARAAA